MSLTIITKNITRTLLMPDVCMINVTFDILFLRLL